MAKVSEKTQIGGGGLADDDFLYVVDTSEGEGKKVSVEGLRDAMAVGVLRAANNLDDVGDPATARTNLGIVDGASTLDDLDDVDTTTTPPTDGQALVYDDADDTWKPGTVAGSGGGRSTAWHGARLHRNAAVVSTTGAFATLTYNTESLDTDGFANLGTSSSRFTIPSGVSHIRLILAIRENSSDAFGSHQFSIFKNGTQVGFSDGGIAGEFGQTSSYSNGAYSFISGVLPVTAGDYFEARAFLAESASIEATFELEVLGGSILAA